MQSFDIETAHIQSETYTIDNNIIHPPYRSYNQNIKKIILTIFSPLLFIIMILFGPIVYTFAIIIYNSKNKNKIKLNSGKFICSLFVISICCIIVWSLILTTLNII